MKPPLTPWCQGFACRYRVEAEFDPHTNCNRTPLLRNWCGGSIRTISYAPFSRVTYVLIEGGQTMRLIKKTLTLIVSIFFIVIGIFIIAVSLKLISPQDITNILDFINANYNVQLTLGITGVLLIVFSILGAQLTLGKMRREKTIAFTNPDGQVTVSLSAIEDFIRKIAQNIEEVKELKSDVIAGKKGIHITTKVILWADTNIPETTERIQQLIKGRLQEMLSIEDTIHIRVHVSKIAQKGENAQKTHSPAPEIPFRSYDYGKK